MDFAGSCRKLRLQRRLQASVVERRDVTNHTMGSFPHFDLIPMFQPLELLTFGSCASTSPVGSQTSTIGYFTIARKMKAATAHRAQISPRRRLLWWIPRRARRLRREGDPLPASAALADLSRQ